MSVKHNEPKFTDPATMACRGAVEHRATWMGLIYDELKRTALIRSRHSEEPSRDAETSTVQTLRLPVPIRMTAGISLRYS